jgi:hypothetical protein
LRVASTAQGFGPALGPRKQNNPPRHVQDLGPQIDGPPIVKPTYGRITTFNLNSRGQVWTVANGDGPRDLTGMFC